MMNLKKKAVKAFKLYFVLVTLITVLLLVLGLTLDAGRTFGYQVFMSPLVYAAIGVIPVFLFDQEKELSFKGLIIRRIAELAIIETVIMAIAFSADTIPTERKSVVIGIAVGIAAVYLLTSLVEYITESMEAKQLNECLLKYQKKADS